jgi:hypothetical protein
VRSDLTTVEVLTDIIRNLPPVEITPQPNVSKAEAAMAPGDLVAALQATHRVEVGGQSTEVMTLQLPADKPRADVLNLLTANDGMGLCDALCSQRKESGYFFAVIEFNEGVWAFWESHAAHFDSIESLLSTTDEKAALNSHEKTLLRLRAHV